MNLEPVASDILDLLVRHEYLTPSNGQVVHRFMRKWQLPSYDALRLTALLSESELANALSTVLKIDRLYHLDSLTLAEEALGFMTFARARAWACLVLKGESGRLELVMADPTDAVRIAEIRAGTGQEFTLAVAERGDIVRAVDELYPLRLQLPSLYGG